MSFLSNAEIVIKALNDYYQQSISREKPVIDQVPLGKIIAALELSSHISAGGLSGESLSQFITKYLSSTTRLHHPAYLAHQVAVPHYAGALAALIDGFTNNPMAIYEMGPGAAGIEYYVVNWLLEKVGWQPAPLKMQSNILCFRTKGGDELQLELRDKLNAQGDFFLSTTSFNAKRYLRLVFMHPNTSLDDIKQLIRKIRHLINTDGA
ncbi:MAG: hypothetical protein BBJ57_08615 [Desulfobacterales bacterium PC51MH44]|nr:MAG: hypothetical protein BBJ57_08615 [Desulfobacterales bacterium PC51MH44]